jgi:hypothetical protein
MKNGKVGIVKKGAVTELTISSKTFGTHLCLIDTEDLPKLKDWCFCLIPQAGKLKVQLTTGRTHRVYLHRLLLGEPIGLLVDHKNNNPLDNRKDNLRVCTNQQNMENRDVNFIRGASGIRGVYWRPDRNKWHAKAELKGKSCYIGSYDSKDDAAAAIVQWRRNNMPFSEMDKEAA